jgi:hypothetical protein
MYHQCPTSQQTTQIDLIGFKGSIDKKQSVAAMDGKRK